MPVDFSYKKIVRVYILWWIAWTAVQTGVLTYVGLPFLQAAVDSLISNAITSLMGLVIYNILRFYQPEDDNSIYLRLWALLLSVSCVTANNFILQNIYDYDEHYLKLLHQSLPIRFCFCLLMLALLTLLNWIRYYYLAIQEKINREADTEKMVREAELSKLRQQLQPHFLFNSLNSISALAGSRPEEARKMIQQLSDFLRGTLKKDDQQLVSLREELQHLNLYLDIEKVRFGHRLNTSISCSPELEAMMLPSLLLQPLVENAIKFGLYDTTEPVLIEIHTAREGNDLVVEIRNPFDPLTAMPKAGTGFGLTSVQRRLHLLYARTDLLKTSARDNHFITIVNIPQQV
jgi:two-component system LytT family sensor kinase